MNEPPLWRAALAIAVGVIAAAVIGHRCRRTAWRIQEEATSRLLAGEAANLDAVSLRVALLAVLPLGVMLVGLAAAAWLVLPEAWLAVAVALLVLCVLLGVRVAVETRLILERCVWGEEVRARGAVPFSLGAVACNVCGSSSDFLDDRPLANDESRRWVCASCGAENLLGPHRDSSGHLRR